MFNRDHLVDGLHSILEELWEGSTVGRIRVPEADGLAYESQSPPFRRTRGDFPGAHFREAQDLSFLESAAAYARYRSGTESWRFKHFDATC